MPMEILDRQDVPPNALDGKLGAQLHAQGFDAAALVMLGGVGAGQASGLPGYWARFVMVEGVGVWAMELTHAIAGYADLYTNDRANDLNGFDNMDCACGTHPTAYTKVQLGWLDPSAIMVDTAARAVFELHTLGLVQPPPAGRCTAVRIVTNGNPLFVEARQRVDQYDGGNAWNKRSQGPKDVPVGISSEGVIIYELAGVEDPNAPPGETDPLIRLLTQTALTPGASFTSSAGVTVQVTAALAGGFAISIDNPTAPSVVVPDLFQLSFKLAVKQLRDLGLVPKPTSGAQHAWVSSQSPLAGHVVARGATVTMVLRTGPIQ
jgi:hypothetical protein